MFIPRLREIQDRVGWLPREELEALAARLDVPLSRLHEVISFFPHFRRQPPPDLTVRVCRDQACHLRGAVECTAALEAVAAELGGERRVKVEGVSCLGRCDGAPAALVELHRAGAADESRIIEKRSVGDCANRLRDIARAHLGGQPVPHDHVDHAPLGWKIDPYGEQAGADAPAPYSAAMALAAKIRESGGLSARKAAGQYVLDELRTADLRGMGGAGRPAFTKWGEVRDETERADQAYVVCNGDESEPSTFKDRELFLRAPHLIVEGMVTGALVVGATRGYVYIRHEYHDQIHAVEAEIERARALGVVGPNVLGTGQAFELEAFTSPGGYVCGEQSALIEAIEEHRSEPRNRPPVIEANGLFNCPTLLNNVETFAWVPAILLKGGVWYRDSGVAESAWYLAKRRPDDKPDRWPRGRGLRFFSLCGDVAKPGVFEVPAGITIGELIDMAGGMRDGLPLLAFMPSGPSGGFLPARLTPADLPPKRRARFPAGRTEIDLREIPLDKAEFDDLGLMLGAGLLAVAAVPGVSAAERILDIAVNATRFFRNETCGKCVPCRVGTQKLVLIGERLQSPTGLRERESLFATVRELQLAMEQTSICGLGTSASKPMASLYEHDWAGAST